MIVEQIWTANSYRNFNYLIACEETGEASFIVMQTCSQMLAGLYPISQMGPMRKFKL